jgi:hypothetical protein
MRHVRAEAWVVYQMPVKGQPEGMRAVCEQQEWDAMERSKPGHFTLIASGILNEGQAEQLARGKAGATLPRKAKQAMVSFPGELVVSEETAPQL